ncbi:hypothetical protein [Microlunatus parietis]|uniref:Uncharacterized protein n=1 Tax=Microlunatus parietis TaxID=682979 RepID=A0A7Y9LBS7_9ACTN|nr:hypothetical protein [Microlunatus parietis]NYE72062.1 hypothetical protein [Microlunatus parietis]
MPDPDPWDFSEFADPDPRQPRRPDGSGAGDQRGSGLFGPGGQDNAGGAPSNDPFGGSGDQGGLAGADWTGSGTVGVAALEIARPPLPYLGLAAGISLVALLLAALLGAIPGLAITAWVLAGPVAIGVLAYFIKADTAERARPVYAAPGWVRPAYVAALVLCGVAVVVAALRIAFWVGRL